MRNCIVLLQVYLFIAIWLSSKLKLHEMLDMKYKK